MVKTNGINPQVQIQDEEGKKAFEKIEF